MTTNTRGMSLAQDLTNHRRKLAQLEHRFDTRLRALPSQFGFRSVTQLIDALKRVNQSPGKKLHPRLSKALKEKIQSLRQKKIPAQEVAKTLRISIATVYRHQKAPQKAKPRP